MKKPVTVKDVVAYIQAYGMTAYMITIGNRSRLYGCNPFYVGLYSDLESVEASYSYVKRVFDSL